MFFLFDREENTFETFETEEELTSYLLNEIEQIAANYGLFNLAERIGRQFTCVKGETVKIKTDYNFSLTLG